MKKLFLTTLFLIFIFSSFLFAQEEKTGLHLVYSLSRPSCDPIIMQLDSLGIELQNNPTNYGYIIVVGGENPIDNIIYQQAAENHLKQRGINDNRYSVLTTKRDGNKIVTVETWISTNGMKPIVEKSQFNYILPDNRLILFNKDMITVTKIDGETVYFGDCTICCLLAFDLKLLSDFLVANPTYTARLIIFSKNKRIADRLKHLIFLEVQKVHKSIAKRLKFKYGGKNKLSNPDVNDFSEISDLEVWLIPKK